VLESGHWQLAVARKGLTRHFVETRSLLLESVVFSPEEENEQHAFYILERFDHRKRKDEVTEQYQDQ
jgi:hypothetical protein